MSKSYNTNAIKNRVSAFYSYNDIDSTYIFFVNNDKNIYIETLSGSIIIPYSDIKKYNRLNLFYIISLQLTTTQTNIYHCNTGYRGVYKETRHWYIISNIYWRSRYISFGDYCYFKENPENIDLSVCDTDERIGKYIEIFNKKQDPHKILNWVINYEITAIFNKIYEIELDINRAKNIYNLLGIIKKHFNITEDIILKIFWHIEEDISI
jgi:hypothetical protein